ncbi:COX15/CtaA family protein [Persicobacter psychrovividus]|uniref:Heme A synthase n=1 Tax=Persicobacter psychrovividus TaxID=387638 RepID=A0ABM7VFH7_9BACT|nr:heme A synthase [Persicobacter psychrovividus]
MNQSTSLKGVYWWLLSGCALIFLMVVIGGITRLTQSGLSMTDWRPITGTLPPLTDTAWQIEFAKYQNSPEFQKLNYHFELADFKSIFWWEYIHRLLGRVIGMVFFIPFIAFALMGKLKNGLMKRCLWILALGFSQGLMGWYMVKSGLVDRPYVSHYRLAAHFSLALITMAVIFWTALQVKHHQFRKSLVLSQQRKASNLMKVFIGAIGLQLIYGAFVAGLKAGHIYNTFPKMGERWVAESVTAMSPWINNFLSNGAGVQFVHRYLGIALFLGIVGMSVYAYRTDDLLNRQRRGVYALMGIILLQVALGIGTLLMNVPVFMGVIHQAVAVVVLLTALYSLFSLRSPLIEKTKNTREASNSEVINTEKTAIL